VVSYEKPVSVLRAVTFAPGTAEPVESTTVPPRSAVVYCAVICAHSSSKAHSNENPVVVKSFF
jgi:hypothetical protein